MISNLLLLFAQAPAAPAQTTPAPQVRDVSTQLEEICTRNNVPGIVALALRGHDIVGRGAAGVRKRGAPEKVSFADQFHIGSCTKAMTATLAAILVEEGKLKWNTSLFEVFPDLEAKAASGWNEETLSALLQNRGGLPAELMEDNLWIRLWRATGPARDQRRMLLEGVLLHPPLSQPGSTYLYANANYAVAGSMCEAAAGGSYEELITKKLFEPLGMTSAGFGPPGNASSLDQPRGHEASGTPVGLTGNADNPECITPAGRVHCTISDWSKFIAFHLAGARAVRGLAPETGTKLLSKESFEMLQSSPEGPDKGYAMGWGVTTRPWGGDVLVHSGSNNLWYCVVWIAPEKDFAVLACCNQGGKPGETACDNAATALITSLLGPTLAPKPATPQPQTPK
ncbi:MAG: beta-lactamase family protein [Planctomycetes bacterium]|nr:beta-lactamase family protein [Planctomycetota bacterium]